MQPLTSTPPKHFGPLKGGGGGQGRIDSQALDRGLVLPRGGGVGVFFLLKGTLFKNPYDPY